MGSRAIQFRNPGLPSWTGCRKWAGLFALTAAFALFSGCATTSVLKREQGSAGTNGGNAEARLEFGRHGFVIRETPTMDAESLSEFDQAVALMKDGKNEQAIKLLENVIDRSPGVTAPYIDIAEASLRIGEMEQAEQYLKTALELVPHHPVASNEYGLLLRKSGRFQEAREIYEQALASFPDYYPIRRNLGILCDLYLNDPECALKQFETYSEGMPADAQVKIWIAELRMRLGRPDPKQVAKPAETKEAVKQAAQQEGNPSESAEAAKPDESAQNVRDNGEK
jgi:tetratricopeptide (TPR) repeat protein